MNLVRTDSTFHAVNCPTVQGKDRWPWAWAKDMTSEQLAFELKASGTPIKECRRCLPLTGPTASRFEAKTEGN